MAQGFNIWLLVVLALVAANLPFVSQRLLGVIPLRQHRKNLAARLAELAFWYVVIGFVGRGMEAAAGQVHTQGWQFYAVTAALFVTLAFPGFVYRYLTRHGI
jgi:hypothetical protein